MILHPARMGQHNKRALVRQLQKLGIASRADLAKSLGMSQPTAGKIVDELLSVKILEEVEIAGNGDHGSARLGRPGRQLQLNRSRSGFLGIHLGVQETFLAELPLGADDEDCWRLSFRNPESGTNPASGAAAAASWEKELGAAAKKLKSKNFLGVLVSVPGLVDEGTNRVLFSPNIHWSEGADLAAVIRRIWDVPVLLVQEERAVALGHLFKHPDLENFLLVDFGEGVGGAVIVGGKPYASPLPVSGELGHTPVIGNRRRCGCGATGCVETLVSLRGLQESFAAAHPDKKSGWEILRRHVEEHGIEPWLAQALDAAAVAITAALNVLGLRHVVVTGSLTELPAGVLAHLSRAIQDGALWARFGRVDCVAAPRRRAGGLVVIGVDRLVVPEMSN